MSQKLSLFHLTQMTENIRYAIDSMASGLDSIASSLGKTSQPISARQKTSKSSGLIKELLSSNPAKNTSTIQDLELRLESEFEPFSPDWKMPSRVGHLDLEVVRISPDDISFGPVKIASPGGELKKTNVPMIIIEGTQTLSENSGTIALNVNNLFDTAKQAIIKERLGCSIQQSETLLKKLVNRIQGETGWSHGDSLLNLLIREWLEPQISGGHIKLPSDLEDTLRVYFAEEGGLIQWTSFPYHAASFVVGDVIQKDFSEDESEEEGYDDYGEEEWDTGDPG